MKDKLVAIATIRVVIGGGHDIDSETTNATIDEIEAILGEHLPPTLPFTIAITREQL